MSLNYAKCVSLDMSLVRSHLEYASCISSPYKIHIEAVERVHRRATKQLPSLKDLSYPESLTITNPYIKQAHGDTIVTLRDGL